MSKDTRANQQQMMSIDKFGEHNSEVKERVEIRERPALRKKVKEEENLQ